MQAHEEQAVTSSTSSCAPLVSDRVRRLRTLARRSNDDTDRVVSALCTAAARLSNDRSSLASALRRDLVESTRLSPAMVEWGLTTTLNTVQPALLRELALVTRATTHCQPIAHRLVAVVLAGNLFSAAVRALFLPLLAGANVIAKAAHHDAALPSALKRALDEVDHEIGERLEIVQFGREDGAATTALLAHADAVSAYGDDSTLRTLSGQMRSSTRLIAHGHGVSAVYIAREQLSSSTPPSKPPGCSGRPLQPHAASFLRRPTTRSASSATCRRDRARADASWPCTAAAV